MTTHWRHSRQPPISAELITEALEIWTDMEYLNGIGLANSYLGMLHLSLEEWDMAIEYC